MTSVPGKRLRLLWSDLLGVERGKYLYGKKAEHGHANFAMTTMATTLHRDILPIPGLAYDVGLGDIEARLDQSSIRDGWEKETRVGIGDLYRNDERFAIDPRAVLERACRPWLDRGLQPQLAFEFEFYLLRPADEGGWLPLETPGSRVYGTGMSVDPDSVVEEIVETAVRSGFPIEAWSSEFDDSQFEVNLNYRDAMAAADDAFLFRILVREVAARRGCRATFIGKPFADRSGCGLHVNVSFRDPAGENALFDPREPDGLSVLAHRSMAGMLAHHRGTAAICAPTVNAYRRLQPDMMNGYWANWGYDDRTVAVRISPERGQATRLENRVADGAANPYLFAAALLHVTRFGVEGDLELPAPQPLGEPPAALVHVAGSLCDALTDFAADRPLREALGPDLVDAFTAMKLAEWDRYVTTVEDPATTDPTAWELDYYTPFF